MTTAMPPRLVPPVRNDATSDALRAQVRAFLADQLAAGAFRPSIDSWLCGWDEGFTSTLAKRGWLGMTVPRHYGGHGRSFFHERFVVTEELLAAAPPPLRLIGSPIDRLCRRCSNTAQSTKKSRTSCHASSPASASSRSG